jgi:maleylacetoacetate isomerase
MAARRNKRGVTLGTARLDTASAPVRLAARRNQGGAAVKLYGFFRSSAAFRTRVALNLKALDYQQVPINLRANAQRGDEYLALNPMGIVPTLIDGDTVVDQSLAIIEYLEETHPTPALLPSLPADRARVRAIAMDIACEIHPVNNLRVRRYILHTLGQDEKALENWMNHWTKLGFDGIEPTLRDRRTGEFCHGDAPGMADICLVPGVFNARTYPSFDLTSYPNIMRIFDNCMKLDAFQRALPERQPDAV